METDAFPQPWPFGAFEQYLGEPGFLVATEDGVCGYVVGDTVKKPGGRVGHVKNLAVHPEQRGRGIGTSLLDRAMAILRGQGVGPIKLEVRRGNEGARELYRSQGFEHRATVNGYYDDGEDALLLVHYENE